MVDVSHVTLSKNLTPLSLVPDWLNRPTFVYSFEEGEYVYFLFYETAIEVKTEQVYSRVARICKNDIGSGQEYFSNYFLSYR